MLSAYNTNRGIKKKVNQDACLLMEAELDCGSLDFAAIADGMGGLFDGEKASSAMLLRLQKWFSDLALYETGIMGVTRGDIIRSMNRAILEVNKDLYESSGPDRQCGTTLTGVILYHGRYLCFNIGDSRVYRISRDGIMRLTHDQSFVQDMIDNGRLTEEEAETHPQRNILLQCVGAEKEVVPKYTNGSYREGDVFLLCSDGLRHKISEAEMFEALRPGKNTTEEELREALEKMVQTAMEREELDNITAAAVITSIGE